MTMMMMKLQMYIRTDRRRNYRQTHGTRAALYSSLFTTNGSMKFKKKLEMRGKA